MDYQGSHIDTQNKGGNEELYKVLRFSVVFGAVFGVFAAVTYYFMSNPFRNNPFFYLSIPGMAALISGAAGVGGYYLDKLFIQLGMSNQFLRTTVTFLLLATVTQGGAVLVSARLGSTGWEPKYLWGGFVGCLCGAIMAIIQYRDSRAREKIIKLELENQYLAEIAAKDQQLHEITRNLAIAEERNRMARELHDSISQGIHGLIFAVNSLKQGLPPDNERLQQIAALLEETANGTLNELRAMIVELKPALLGERGLTEAIKVQGELFARRHQVEMAMALDDIRGLSAAQETAIYRIFQEALTNIGRHSGAGKVTVGFKSVLPGRVVFTIEDNGQGFHPATVQKGNGLLNMEARSREAGGDFHLQAEPGKGTKIEVGMEVTLKNGI